MDESCRMAYRWLRWVWCSSPSTPNNTCSKSTNFQWLTIINLQVKSNLQGNKVAMLLRRQRKGSPSPSLSQTPKWEIHEDFELSFWTLKHHPHSSMSTHETYAGQYSQRTCGTSGRTTQMWLLRYCLKETKTMCALYKPPHHQYLFKFLLLLFTMVIQIMEVLWFITPRTVFNTQHRASVSILSGFIIEVDPGALEYRKSWTLF